MNSATRGGVAHAPEETLPRRRERTTRRSPAKLRCVHRWIEMQAERAPEAIALTCAGESLTYSQLNARANRLAHRLRALGVGPEVLVAASLRRAVSVYGGRASWPSSRRGRQVCATRPDPIRPSGSPTASGDARATGPPDAVRPARSTSRARSTRVIWPDRDCVDDRRGTRSGNLAGGAGLRNLAYVIYTSGSTGRPKRP